MITQIIKEAKDFIKTSRWNQVFLISLVFTNIIYLILTIFFNPVYDRGDDFVYWRYFYLGLFKGETPKFAQFWPPGLPFAILGFSYITGDFFLAGKLIMIQSAVLLLLASYLILRRIFSEPVAFFSVLLMATNRHLLFYFVFSINSQVPFTALVLLAIYCLLREYRKSNLVASSIFLGLASLIRVTGFFFFPAIILRILIHEYSNYRKKNLKFKVKQTALTILKYFGIFVLVLSPYFLINVYIFGNPFRNDNIENFYDAIFYFYKYKFSNLFGASASYYPEEPPNYTKASWIDLLVGPETSPLFYHSVSLKFLIGFPSILFEKLFYYKFPAPISSLINPIFHPSPLSFFIATLFVIITIFGYSYNYILKEKPNNKRYLMSKSFFGQLILITFLLFASMGFLEFRFLIPVIPFIMGSFIFVLIQFINALKVLITKIIHRKKGIGDTIKLFRKNEKVMVASVLILSLFVGMQLTITTASLPYSRETEEIVEYKIAGDFLKERVSANDIVIMQKYNYLYYIGDCIAGDYPAANLLAETAFEQILEMNAQYLIYSERIEGYLLVNLNLLYNPSNENIPEEFELIFQNNETGKRIVIYEIL